MVVEVVKILSSVILAVAFVAVGVAVGDDCMNVGEQHSAAAVVVVRDGKDRNRTGSDSNWNWSWSWARARGGKGDDVCRHQMIGREAGSCGYYYCCCCCWAGVVSEEIAKGGRRRNVSGKVGRLYTRYYSSHHSYS